MKAVVLVVAVGSVSGCIQNYDLINTHPYQATEEDIAADDYILQGTMKSIQGFVVPVQEHQFQFLDVLCGSALGGYLAEYKGWNEKISTYNPTDDWTASSFINIIPGFYSSYNQLLDSTEDEVALSVAKIVKVAVFSQLTDIYGPIPYSKIGEGDALSAPYDSQKEVYDKMFSELGESVDILTSRITSSMNAKSDMVFAGDITKWVRYANSLKLRLAMRVVYADEKLAREMAESAVNHEVGVIRSNEDNPVFSHPTQNLYYMLCIQWGDYRAAADIVSYMNGYEDPRRAMYFTESAYGGYKGWRRGTAMNMSNNGDNCSNMKVSQSDLMMWMNAAEVSFLMAEGALRKWDMGETAKSLYENGIRLSFEQWGVADAEKYILSTRLPENYTDPTGSGYGGNFGTSVRVAWVDGGDFEVNLEQIITQKWIANWKCTGVEAWSEFRRTGYPKLLVAGVNYSGGVIAEDSYARRLVYPVDEKNSNTENYNAALAKLGGPDNMATRLWWDCNPKVK